MPILQIAKDGVLLQEIEIRTATINIGRDPEIDVRLADLTVSRRHGRLKKDTSGRYVIEDLQSRNGIMLNDQLLIRPVALADGDRMQVGVYQLTFLDSGAATPPRQNHFNAAGDKALAMATKPTHVQNLEQEHAQAERRRENAAAPEIGILVNEANNAIFTLDRDQVVLGSEGEVDIRVPGPERRRATIARRGEHFYLCSETPVPCVSVNGRPVMNAQLAYNDRIAIGERRFIFRKI